MKRGALAAVAAVLALAAVAAVLPLATGGIAHADVWPVPARALCAGPFAALDPSALGVWSNPALAAVGPAWRAGIGSLEPFEVPSLARLDAAAGHRRGAYGASAGWSRFGESDLCAHAGALALGARAGTSGAIAFGVSGRRVTRDSARAFALDAGLRAAPWRSVAAGVVARSVARAGALEVAPDPEWEIDLSWSAGAAAIGASVTRDATGPVASALASRMDAGPLRIYSQLERVAGGETRVAIGLETRIGLGLRCFLGRDEGPVLSESRAGGVEWGSETRGESRPRAHATSAIPHAPSAPDDSLAEAAWDSLADRDAMEDGVDLDALSGAASGDPVEVESVESETPPAASALESQAEVSSAAAAPGAQAPAAQSPNPQAPAALTWQLTLGGRPDRESGLGASAAIAFRSPATARWRPDLDLCATRDPGERGIWDEHRSSFALARGDRLRLLLGAFDVTQGADLGSPSGVRSAATLARSPTSALTGAAATLALAPRLRAELFLARASRDARQVQGGAWPILGRYHRTTLERSRRDALPERESGLSFSGTAFAPSSHAAAWSASWTRAAYGGTSPRRFPDGTSRRGGDWLAVSWSHDPSWRQTLVLGPGGAWGSAATLRWSADRSTGVGASLTWQHRSPGFSAPEAIPRTEPLDALEARLEAHRRRARPGAWLTLRSQTRWSSPGTTGLAVDRVWDRWIEGGLRLGPPARGLSLESSRRETWKQSSDDPVSAFGLMTQGVTWITRARASWRPPDAACRVWLTWRSRGLGPSALESWQLAVVSDDDAPGAALAPDWAVTADILPGRLLAPAPSDAPANDASAAEGLEATPDPLSGVRWESRSSPARLSARLGIPLRASRLSRAEVESRFATPSGKTRLELWLTVRGQLDPRR